MGSGSYYTLSVKVKRSIEAIVKEEFGLRYKTMTQDEAEDINGKLLLNDTERKIIELLSNGEMSKNLQRV